MDKQFEQRMDFLVRNPSLGIETFESLVKDHDVSNCHGTTFFGLGLYDNARPVYVGPEYLEKTVPFLFKRKEQMNRGDMVVLYDKRQNSLHSGIVYTEKKSNPLILHQIGPGQLISVNSLKGFRAPYADYLAMTKIYSLVKKASFQVEQNTFLKSSFLPTLEKAVSIGDDRY